MLVEVNFIFFWQVFGVKKLRVTLKLISPAGVLYLMPALITGLLGLGSLLAVLLFFLASFDISKNLSPQGCRMSWMSPSYVLQTGFDTSWSPLARRYTLWLYREVGWDSVHVCNNTPP